jgi:hypothetical protein
VRATIGLVLAALVALVILWRESARPFPSDHTPDGAYLRIALDVQEDRIRDAFPYLETEAQWAAYSIRDLRSRACARVRASYPDADKASFLGAYLPLADAPDGADVFNAFARQKGWVGRLRRDLSGVARVEIEGERASVTTARGTRYPFRRRENGIWGLTIFTADLIAESERAARDLAVVSSAADDYDRAARAH